MGIKNFMNVFGSVVKYVSYNDLNSKYIAIDASYEIYRALTAMHYENALRDPSGNPTVHINAALNICAKLNNVGARFIWIFDHPKSNNIKSKEIDKRKKQRQKAQDELKEIETSAQDDPFLGFETKEDRTAQLQKRTVVMNSGHIRDIKFLLDCLDVEWIEAPANYEAESIAANMPKVDFVMTEDTDVLAFGAKALLRRNKKDKKKELLEVYYLQDVLTLIKPTADISDLHKIAAHMGCDFCNKTKGVGPKTVLKIYNDKDFTDEQMDAMEEFAKLPPRDMATLVQNKDAIPFSDLDKKIKLHNWLVSEKGFNSTRVSKLIKI